MPDALAYTVDDRATSRAASADADLAAVLQRVLRDRERRRRQETGEAIDLGGGVDLLALSPSATMANAGDSGGDVADLTLGGLPLMGAARAPLGGVTLDPVRLGGSAPVDSVGGGEGPGDAGGGSGGAALGTEGLPTSVPLASVGPFSLAFSPLSGLSLGVGGRAGGVGVSASPISGVSVGARATPSSNSGVNLALASVLQALGVPLSLAIAKGLVPAAAAFTGPAGLAVQGFNGMIDLSTALVNALGGQSVAQFAAAQDAAATTSPTFGELSVAALADIAMGKIAASQAAGLTATALTAQEAQALAQQGGPQAVANMFSDGRGSYVSFGPHGLGPSAVGVNFTSGPNQFGTGPRGNDAPPAVPAEFDLEGAAFGGGGGGVGSGAGAGTGGTGPGGSDGNAGAGPSAFLATWAMNGLGMGPEERRENGWAAFHKMFAKRFPLTGESQFRRYGRLARQVVEALEKLPLPEQRRAQKMIYARIVAPLGETLELHEVDEAWTAMRSTALLLARRLGLRVDPADVPRPAHEIAARARKVRDERRAKARASVTDEKREA